MGIKALLNVAILSLILLLISVMGGVGFDFTIGKTLVSLHSLKNVLIATIFFWIIKMVVSKETKFVKTDLNLPVIFYLATFVLASIFSSEPKVSFLYLRDFVLCAGMTCLLIDNVDNKNKLEAVLFIFLISVLYTVSRGIFQHVKGGMGDYYSFVGRAEFGAVTLLSMPVLIGFLLNYRKNLVTLLFSLTGLMILMTGLIISYSRGSWVGFVIVFLFFVFLHIRVLKNWRFFLLNALVVIFLVLVLPLSVKNRINSIADFPAQSGDRIPIWRSSVKMVRDFPFLGVGPGTYDVVSQQYKGPESKENWPLGWHAHNIFLHIASENGMIGLVSFLAIVFVSFRKYFELRNKVKDSKLKNFLDGTVVSLVGYLACSQTTIFFANHNKNEKIAMLLWFDIALIFIIENISRKREEVQ